MVIMSAPMWTPRCQSHSAVNHTGNHMLPRVLLHQVKSPFPINGPGNDSSHLHGSFCVMDHLAVPFVGICHLHIMQSSPVPG